MSPRDWKVRVEDMLAVAERSQASVVGVTYEAFSRDWDRIEAAAHRLMVIGEAASHVDPRVVERHPRIPWKRMRGMRNVVAHQYFDVDVATVWKTVTEDVPRLIPQLRELLESEPDDA